MKKRVLFVTQSIWAGGTNSALCSLYNNIDKSKYDITVWAIDHFGRRKVDYEPAMVNNQALAAAYYSSGHFSNIFERLSYLCVKVCKKIVKSAFHISDDSFDKYVVRRFERKYQYDTVVAYSEHIVRFCSHFSCSNKIAWVHCDYELWRSADESEENYYKEYNKIVTVSKTTTDAFKRCYPSLSERCLSIYNLIDSTRIKKLAKEIIDDKRFIKENFTILSVGRVTEVKRFREIPGIAKNLKSIGLAFKWYIVGPLFSEDEYNAITNGILKNSVEDCVIMLGGKTNPYPYFKSADLYVCTSESEACPMVFIEAQILGTPIVTTDFPAAFEFIQDGKNGYVSSLKELPRTIEKCIVNVDLYSSMVKYISDESFSNEDILQSTYDIL